MTAVLPPAIETGCEHGSSDMKNRAEKRVTEANKLAPTVKKTHPGRQKTKQWQGGSAEPG